MQLIKQVIHSAKERALIKFSALIRMMVKDADDAIVQEMSSMHSRFTQRALSTSLYFLRQEKGPFISRIDSLFAESVDRALRTMYTDLRQGLDNLSANTLSLIDEETVIRQLEVGHLVQQLRDACDENLGRLNIIIAQIHDDSDVHERENPFRPYLIARALHQALNEKVTDEEVSKVLFVYFSNALAEHLSDYYASICAVFDSSGIRARLLARPTRLKRHQRDQLAQQLASLHAPSPVHNSAATGKTIDQDHLRARILPSLHRMFEIMQEKMAGMPDAAPGHCSSASVPGKQRQAENFQNFVWDLFNQAKPAETTGPGESPAGADAAGSPGEPASFLSGSAELMVQLGQLQKMNAIDDAPEDLPSTFQHQLLAINDQLTAGHVTPNERIALDVVGVLFEFMLNDEQIPASTRVQLGRLQIPFLRLALLAPEMLQQHDHPARQLLNRISSAAVELDPDLPLRLQLDAVIARLVKRVLGEFDQDITIFSACLEELEQFLTHQLADASVEMVRSIQAAQEAENLSILYQNTGVALLDLLAPLELDQRAVDFIVQTWARVLVRASIQDTTNASAAGTVSQQYLEVVPQLVWSVQEKRTPEERNGLIRLLPGLVKRLKIGMLMIHLSEEECKAALDRLVAVHMQVLKPQGTVDPGRKSPDLAQLQTIFSRLVMQDESPAWTLAEPLEVQEHALESALSDRGVEAELEVARTSADAFSNSELLAEMKVGTCVECWAADTCVLARMIWVSRLHTLFIFKMAQNAKPLVYSAASLIQALQDGKIRLVEYAPAFDRAVDALMMGVEAVHASRG